MILALLQLAASATGLDPAAFSALDSHRANRDLPGVAAAISRDGNIVFAGAAGVADIEGGRLLTAETPLYAGSVSKVFTAALVLQAVESGELSLDDHPETGGPVDRASVMDLLTHSAGVPREGNFDYWFTAEFPDSETLDDYLSRQPLRHEPGRELAYSNIGYAALGRMLESRTGLPFSELVARRLAGPVRLTATGGGTPPPGISRGYTPRNRVIPSAARPFAGVGEAVGNRFIREYHNAAAMTPAFGLYSSVRDLARFGGELVSSEEDGLLSPSMRHRMLTAQRFGRGLGLRIDRMQGRKVARHGGWFAAHRAHLLLDAEAKIAVAVMVNSDDGDPASLADSLYALAVAAFLAPEPGRQTVSIDAAAR